MVLICKQASLVVATSMSICFFAGCESKANGSSYKDLRNQSSVSAQGDLVIARAKLDEEVVDSIIEQYGYRHEFVDERFGSIVAELGPVHITKKRNKLTHFLWYSDTRVVRIATTEGLDTCNVVVFLKSALEHGRPIINRSEQIIHP